VSQYTLARGKLPRAFFVPTRFPELVHNGVTVHKPDAQANDTAIRNNTSHNKKQHMWFYTLRGQE